TPSTPLPAGGAAYLPKAAGSWPQGGQPSQSSATFNTGALASGVYLQEPYLRATVAPKWPSLYYLFPEFDHNLDGTVVGSGLTHSGGVIDTAGDGVGAADATPEDNVDQRQPKDNLVSPGPSPATLLAAFQPWGEPYVTDGYVSGAAATAAAAATTTPFRVVDSNSPSIVDSGQTQNQTYATPTSTPVTYTQSSTNYSFTYKSFYTPLDDRPVSKVALKPRKLPTSAGFTNPFPLQDNNDWELPISTLPANPPTQNTPPNRIIVPNGDRPTSGVTAVIPFLDRVMFNGREWLPSRVLDFDIGMLRRTSPRSAIQVSGNTANAPNDVWLPVTGIVYAFREDAVREDAINRPASGTYTDATTPSAPTDPPVAQAYSVGATVNPEPKLSIKSVDYVPDPNRRPHGFRLRNGSVLRRHPSRNISNQDNIRGLSFFTDNPVYIMGDYNLHQAGTDDDTNGARLEEFQEQLPTGLYNETQFYSRSTRDTNFATIAGDRWRPSEILADAISVVSNTLCDGSAIDTFMTANSGSGASISETTYSGRPFTDSGAAIPTSFYPYRRTTGDTGAADVYDNSSNGLYGPGCLAANRTTFLNQNRPSTALPSLVNTGWTWMRENPSDAFSPIRVSRNGDGMVFPPLNSAINATPPTPNAPSTPRIPGTYDVAPINGSYYTISDGRPIQTAQDARVNTIIVSGLVPSRINQSYGGMHNFPRFLEDWNNLWFSGSFLQLNFSNYATAPFDLDAVEPGAAPVAGERISYYSPPNRLWGYDVALQLAPAGPAASRFVTANKERNEFYNEPAANDPYIRNLCQAVKTNPPTGVNLTNLNCPT
ncbi:MAG: hypothetical protein WCA35_26810, partial [Kovacikia sp.]